MLTKEYYNNLFKVLEFKEKIKFLKFAFFINSSFIGNFWSRLIYPILQTLTNNEVNDKLFIFIMFL